MCAKRRLISTLMAGNETDIVGSDKFYVKSSTCDFNDRQRDIFGRLSSLEEKHNEIQKETPEPEEKSNDVEPEPDFVVPQRPPIRRKPMPAYVREPRRWTKYSLADVSADQMSDKSNTSAAFDFLNDRKRKMDNEDDDDSYENDKLEFRKPEKVENEKLKIEFRSGKWKMSEYVVGREKKNSGKKENKSNDGASSSFDKVQLGHLNNDDDDGDEGIGEDDEKTQEPSSKSRKCLRKRDENDD